MSKNKESYYTLPFENLPSEIKKILSGNDEDSKSMVWQKIQNENLPSITMTKVWIGVCSFVIILLLQLFN